jgi:hypothetical protein
MDEEESDTEPPMHGKVWSPKLLVGIGAAIFLLAFIASQALPAVLTLRR